MVFSMKEAASGATLPIPSTLSITTNSDSLVEFFIHPCKFLKYSISFSVNKIKFLLSPKIHDYSLTITADSPALEVHAKAAPRWLAQRSLSNRPRLAYLLKPPECQVCGFWEVTKPTWQNKRKSNFLTVDTLLTIIGPSDPQVRHLYALGTYQPTGCQHNCHYTLTLSSSDTYAVSASTIKF